MKPDYKNWIPKGMLFSLIAGTVLSLALLLVFGVFGICVLMKKLGLYDLTPALCHLDYTMSEAGGVTDFVRQYTLASGGPYCDCGYKKKKL